MKPTVIVMLKQPRPGRVKTRLGRDIGMVTAAWWFRHQVKRLLRRIDDARWNTVLAVAPDREGMASRVWPAHLPKWPQGRGDLGARMVRMMRQVRGPVCVVGADIPLLETYHIAEAFNALGAHDAVFGPAPDGGYWLFGVKHGAALSRNALNGVRWSSEHALADSESALGYARIARIATLADVDTVADLRLLHR